MSQQTPFPPGTLAVVSTPIGNLADISERGVQVLRDADLVAAEDTRTAKRLLAHYGIDKPLISYHDWNEASRSHTLIERLQQGVRIALVSEAGTPTLSDPGFDLVRAARRAGITIFPVPGPSALTAFLSVSGLPTDRFTFVGFAPNRTGKRRKFYEELADRPETLIFYESPHRIVAALADALEVFGDREMALGREMTKLHEEFLYGTLSQVHAELSGRERVRGEVCWGLHGVDPEKLKEAAAANPQALETELARAAAGEEPLKAAAKRIGAVYGLPTKELYAKLSALRRESE